MISDCTERGSWAVGRDAGALAFDAPLSSAVGCCSVVSLRVSNPAGIFSLSASGSSGSGVALQSYSAKVSSTHASMGLDRQSICLFSVKSFNACLSRRRTAGSSASGWMYIMLSRSHSSMPNLAMFCATSSLIVSRLLRSFPYNQCSSRPILSISSAFTCFSSSISSLTSFNVDSSRDVNVLAGKSTLEISPTTSEQFSSSPIMRVSSC